MKINVCKPLWRQVTNLPLELINDVKDSALPRGHYSQAVVHNELVYVSGQLGINLHTQSTEVGTIKDQTENILTSISHRFIDDHL